MTSLPGSSSLALLASLLALGGGACGDCSSERMSADAASRDASPLDAGATESGAAEVGDGATEVGDGATEVGDGATEMSEDVVDGGFLEAGEAGAVEAGGEAPLAEVGPNACVPRPTIRTDYSVFACSPIAQWEIHDLAAYQAAKPRFDEVVDLLDRGYPAVLARLERPLATPFRVVIDQGDCCASFASADHVGYRDGDFGDPSALSWTRGAVLGAVVNAMVAGVSRGWPADWWIDDGFFTALVVSETLKQLTTPAIAETWETEQQLGSSRVYGELARLRDEAGWPLFQRFFSAIAGDAMDWTAVGANPSAIRSNYVIAYLGLAAGRNLGAAFQEAGIDGADPEVVTAILAARQRLVEAQTAGRDVTANWAAYRMGDLAAAVAGL